MKQLRFLGLYCSAFLVCLACVGAWAFDDCGRYAVVDQWGGDGTPGAMEAIMQDLGCKYIRAGWDWNLIEGPGDNQYDAGYLSLMDNFVSQMNAIGVHIYYGFSYTPAWARPGGTQQNAPPTDPTRYTDFITFMVNRYKDSVKDWGLWNEPNLDQFWNGTDDNYIHNFLIPGIAAIKAADPTARVVVGELASCCNEVALLQSFLNEINAHGQKSNVDVVCAHAYGYGDTASGRLAHLDSLHNTIVSAGYGDKDFWCTETCFGPNEADQSTQLMAFMQGMDARRTWWKKTFYFTLTEAVLDTQGLLRPDGTKKPAYLSYQSYIAAHSGDQWTHGNNLAAWSIPRRIEAENYDDGCEGVSYHDTDPTNSGASYRTEGVDIEGCSEGGYNIGWINAGEWMEYTITAPAGGMYSFALRVASDGNGGSYHIELDGNNVTGTRSFAGTGGWQNWATTTVSGVNVSTGGHVLRIYAETGGWNLNYIEITQGGQDTTPPGPVTGFTATPGDTQVTLSWTNPGDADFSGTMIRYRTDGVYPTGPTNGTQIYDGNGANFIHTGLTNGTTYYYRAFAHDSVPNYDTTAAGLSATPVHLVQVTLSNNTFDSDAQGWNTSLWKQGDPSPTMGWVAGAGCPGGAIQCVGAGMTDGTNPATREGGEMWKVISTAPNGGYSNINVSFDVKVNGLGNDYSGVGGTGDHNLLEEQLTVSFSTNGGSTWMEAGYLNRAALNGLQTCGTRSFDLSAYPACNNNASFAVKFRWQLNTGPESSSGADIANIDNVQIKGYGAADTTPPGNITGFTAASGNMQNSLNWTKPGDVDLAGVMIRYRTDGVYPTGPTNGTQCYDGTGTSFAHTGLINGTTYYYKAFAHDFVPNYASGATTSAKPHLSTSIINVKSAGNLNLVIDGNSSDWNLGTDFPTKTRGGLYEQGDITVVGYDSGVCYYGSYAGVLPTGAADHAAKVYARHDQQYLYFLVRCDDSDMWYVHSTDANWANDCAEFFIDPSHNGGPSQQDNSTSDIQLDIDCNNQKNVYMTTTGYTSQVLTGITSAVVRDGTGWWMECKILKSALEPDLANSGTFGIDFLFRDNDNNNDAAQTTVYMWNEPSGSGYPSKIPDHWGDASLATLAPDTTPPAPPTAFALIPGDGRNYLSWTNPSTSDFAGTKVLFKTTGYPANAGDGTVVCDRTAAPGSGDSYIHTGLANTTTHYYSAFAYDEVFNYSTSATTSGVPLRFDPAQAKLLANNTAVVLTTGAVSARWTDSFYAQCVNFPLGIRVAKTGNSVTVGQLAWARGTTQTDPTTGEKYIQADWAQSYGSGVATTLALSNASLGGRDWRIGPNGAGQQGAFNGIGPNNIGLLILAWGKVTQRDPALQYFYIDDGSGLRDGTKTAGADNIGVRIKASPATYPTGKYVIVHGISSCFVDGSGKLRRQILPRTGEIQIVGP